MKPKGFASRGFINLLIRDQNECQMALHLIFDEPTTIISKFLNQFPEKTSFLPDFNCSIFLGDHLLEDGIGAATFTGQVFS